MGSEKEKIRNRVWTLMEREGVSRPPLPIRHRIPNFIGAERAAERLRDLRAFQAARVVKVNPDSPQSPVRKLVLSAGKLLIMPTPRLRRGFLLIDPNGLPQEAVGMAASIRGALKFGRELSLNEAPGIDFMVTGSVAVAPDGSRLGKGGGYSEIEYGILRELGLIDEDTPIATTVHDVQVVSEIPMEDHDLAVDYIVTPTRLLETGRSRRRPRGILWDELPKGAIEEIPILARLKPRCDGGAGFPSPRGGAGAPKPKT